MYHKIFQDLSFGGGDFYSEVNEPVDHAVIPKRTIPGVPMQSGRRGIMIRVKRRIIC